MQNQFLFKGALLYKLLFTTSLTLSLFSMAQRKPQNFIFFSRERSGITDSNFYLNRGISGAQITYTWKNLEPGKGKYDFHEIEEDLNFLQSKDKKLFIQLQDASFDSTIIPVPKYLLTDTIYHGGVNTQYEIRNGQVLKAGWVARRWDTTVATRFHLLLIELSKQFDGRIEGINLQETSLEFTSKTELQPEGFTIQKYLAGIKANMLVMRQHFLKSTPIQYANFMPGDQKEPLIELYDYAKQIEIAMGGPDILVNRKFQMENSYPLIRHLSSDTRTGMAVQEGNYSSLNPKTKRKVTIDEIYNFAKDYLKVYYIFWCTEPPYYYQNVLPFLKSLSK